MRTASKHNEKSAHHDENGENNGGIDPLNRLLSKRLRGPSVKRLK
jgi:hypothetical protein